MKNDKFDIWLKANRKGSRDAELENSSGWKNVHKIHKNKKTYSRKGKNKFNYNEL